MGNMEKFDSRTIRAGAAWAEILTVTDNPAPTLIRMAVKEFRHLAEIAEGFQDLCNKQGETIDLLEYKNKILREQVDSLLKEVKILEEREYNAEVTIRNLTNREDF